MATPYVDLALVYDAAQLRCDAVFDGTDLVLDDTPVTPLLIAIGTDRRAHTDDQVPNMPFDPTRPLTLNARRGWPGDGLDMTGALIGSRIWVYLTQKQTQPVLKGIEGAVVEALDFFETSRGQAVALAVRYPRRNMVSLKVDVAETSLALDLGMLS